MLLGTYFRALLASGPEILAYPSGHTKYCCLLELTQIICEKVPPFRENQLVASSLRKKCEAFILLECYSAWIVSHKCFGTTCRPRLEWSILTLEDGTDRSFVNVGEYQSTLCNIPEERRSHLYRDRRLKPRRTRAEFVKQDWGREP